MTKDKIWEGNELIARFLGYECYNAKTGLKDDNAPFECRQYRLGTDLGWHFINSMPYHKDWNSLMDVVEKIEAIRDERYGWFQVTIQSNTCSVDSKHVHLSIQGEDVFAYMSDPNAIFPTKIESTWYNLVEFIKWYNEKVKR